MTRRTPRNGTVPDTTMAGKSWARIVGALPREEPMDAARMDRQARLKPEGAEHHPSLPVSMWTSAARMAELVAAEPRPQGSPWSTGTGRRLSDADFEFRGGTGHSSGLLHWRPGEGSSSTGSRCHSPQLPGGDD